jgi:hypothetical protein
MSSLLKSGRIDVLMNLAERAPSTAAGAPIWDFLLEEQALEMTLAQPRVDIGVVSRLARRVGKPAATPLIDAALAFDDAKVRTQFYDLLFSIGEDVGATVASRIPDAPPAIRRELLAFLGRLARLPDNFSAGDYLLNPEPLIRREAVKLMLRDPEARDAVAMTALTDEDDRVVFVGLTAAQERCPDGALDLMKQRVDEGELDSQLRTMCIRIIAHHRTPTTLGWLLGHVITEARWPRRPKLRPSTPEMLAALGMIATGWREDPAASLALHLAEQSKEPDVRAKLVRGRPTPRRSTA